MTSRNLALAGLLAAGIASAEVKVPVTVQHDATYLLPKSRGLPCSGDGAAPAGTSCPKAGDIASTNCQPYLLSYNGAVCVAPVDAQCVLVVDDTWGCAFPQTGYTSAAEAETIATYGNKGEKYDKNLDMPLGVNCDVASDKVGETTTGNYGSTTHKSDGATSKHYGSSTTGTTTDGRSGNYGVNTEGSKTTVDYNYQTEVPSSDKTYPTHDAYDVYKSKMTSKKYDTEEPPTDTTQPPVVIPDVVTVIPDIVTVVPDILTVVPDILTVVPDILTVVPDILTVVPDILSVVPDILTVVPDVLSVVPDVLTVVPTLPTVPTVPTVLTLPTVPTVPTLLRRL
ncbi:unnamed protein product [Peronospora effusa]|nr:unnamed protein product [Peronospora effusa]